MYIYIYVNTYIHIFVYIYMYLFMYLFPEAGVTRQTEAGPEEQGGGNRAIQGANLALYICNIYLKLFIHVYL